MKRNLPLITITVLSLVIMLLTGCQQVEETRVRVVTTTALLQHIVERIGGKYVAVVNIIPPAQCPGHYDCKPGDVQKLAAARLFFMHNWQGEKFTTEIIASANNPNLKTIVVSIPGNWMTPPVQLQAIDELTRHLTEIDPAHQTEFEKAAATFKNQVTAKGDEVQKRLAGKNLASINVLCAEQQAGFVKWTGLNVVGTFGPPETMTPQKVKEVVDTGRAKQAKLVIDNLQSGQDAGKGVAEELGASRIILSNFPGGFDDTGTWEKTIDKNIDIILGSVAKLK